MASDDVGAASSSGSAASSAGLRKGFEAALDAAVQSALKSAKLPVPGAVVLARRGPDRYFKAFGAADVAGGVPLREDAMMRFYSMTKVQVSCLTLMFVDRGWLSLTDPVSKLIPSFAREWKVVSPSDAEGDPEVEHCNAMTGQRSKLRYRSRPAKQEMLIKHLMSEHSGLAYEFFSDIGLGQEYAIAWELRRKVAPDFFASTAIVSSGMALREWCDAVAEAGVLVSEPGTYSYGLGATVLGRVLEVAFERRPGGGAGGPKSLEEIFREMLWNPLGMRDAAFFLPDGDARAQRVPVLYGAVLAEDGQSAKVKRIEECYPGACSNQNDHTSGPRRHLSGDTGSLMPVADYAKFYEFLLRGGLSPSGERLLSVAGVDALCRRAFKGLCNDVDLAGDLKGAASSYPQSFNFGWVTTHAHAGQEIDGYSPIDHPRCNYWSGFSNVHGRFYLDDDAYIILAPQVMANTSGAKFMDEVFRNPILQAFLEAWDSPEPPAAKRARLGNEPPK